MQAGGLGGALLPNLWHFPFRNYISNIVATCRRFTMSDTLNLNVRISGALKGFVTEELNSGEYENASEYVRSLIRRDKDKAEARSLEHLRTELALAFAAPDDDFAPVSASDIINRTRPQP